MRAFIPTMLLISYGTLLSCSVLITKVYMTPPQKLKYVTKAYKMLFQFQTEKNLKDHLIFFSWNDYSHISAEIDFLQTLCDVIQYVVLCTPYILKSENFGIMTPKVVDKVCLHR